MPSSPFGDLRSQLRVKWSNNFIFRQYAKSNHTYWMKTQWKHDYNGRTHHWGPRDPDHDIYSEVYKIKVVKLLPKNNWNLVRQRYCSTARLQTCSSDHRHYCVCVCVWLVSLTFTFTLMYFYFHWDRQKWKDCVNQSFAYRWILQFSLSYISYNITSPTLATQEQWCFFISMSSTWIISWRGCWLFAWDIYPQASWGM